MFCTIYQARGSNGNPHSKPEKVTMKLLAHSLFRHCLLADSMGFYAWYDDVCTFSNSDMSNESITTGLKYEQ